MSCHSVSLRTVRAVDIDAEADELYGLTPEQFTPARNARAKEAKSGGDKELAAQIGALRKPSVVAWLANSLSRQRPDEIGAMLDLGEALREASATLSGPELRELSRQRHQLVYAMVQQARALAAETGRRVTDDVARGLEETLTAALTSAGAGELLRRARLTEGLVPGGFPVAATTAQPKTPVRQVSPTLAAAPARAKGPSAEERRLAQRRERLQRDLVAATTLAKKKSAAQEEAAAAFDESQRTLTAAELGLAELRAELAQAEKTRDKAQRDSHRSQTANDRAQNEADQARQRVTDLQSRLDDL
jgi:hypothetical protein